MRRVIQWLVPCALAGLLLLLLGMPEAALNGARDGLTLWAQYVLPSLLPFFVLTQMLVESGSVSRAGHKLAAPFRALFRLPDAGAAALPLAYLGGSPSGARIAGQLVARGELDAHAAARFTAVGAMTGPLFLAATAGSLLGDSRAGFTAMCACVLSALINGVCWRFFGGPPEKADAHRVPLQSPLRFFPGAVRDSAAACIAVGGSIALFSILIALAAEIGALSFTARLFRPIVQEDIAEALLTGVLEMTNGIKKAASLPLAIQQRTAVVTALASFGGLSIAAQAALFLRDIVPMRLYLLQRATQAVIGYFTGAILAPLFLAVPASGRFDGFCMPCILTFLIALLVVCLLFYLIKPLPRPRPRERCGPVCACGRPGCGGGCRSRGARYEQYRRR